MNLMFFKNLPFDMLEALKYYLDFLGAKTDRDVIRFANITAPAMVDKYNNGVPTTFATAQNYLKKIELKAKYRGCMYHYGTPSFWMTNGAELKDVIQLCGYQREYFLKSFDEKNTHAKQIWDGESVVINRKTMATICRLTGSYPEEIAVKCDSAGNPA